MIFYSAFAGEHWQEPLHIWNRPGNYDILEGIIEQKNN